MARNQRVIQIFSAVLIGAGVVLLGLSIYFGSAIQITLPLVFLMLGGAFYLLVSIVNTWAWSAVFYIPGSILLAFGLIFLFNVITRDWNAWAYAWLLLLAGLGLGVTLAGPRLHWRREVELGGVGLMILSVTLFALFGAIAGGPFIQLIAPLLLVLGGLALWWLKPEISLPRPLRQRALTPTGSPDQLSEAEKPLDASLPDAAPLVEPLSARELEVLGLINQGLSNSEIAARLTLANSTVKTHINNIYGKLGVQTRVQALKRARELRLVD